VKYDATLTVNGIQYPVEVDAHRNLVSVLREDCGLTGPKEGCDDCECGACMVLIDGRPVNSCSYLALQAEGKVITTVEGLAAPDGSLSPLQQAFLECGGVQCGFCTPGMLISATALLARNPRPTLDEIKVGVAGNLCRCTGYTGIFDAIETAANATEPHC
jgi:aerobic-type carbon monoxide dehydrogenase small subunit (CoxS/CutS family)